MFSQLKQNTENNKLSEQALKIVYDVRVAFKESGMHYQETEVPEPEIDDGWVRQVQKIFTALDRLYDSSAGVVKFDPMSHQRDLLWKFMTTTRRPNKCLLNGEHVYLRWYQDEYRGKIDFNDDKEYQKAQDTWAALPQAKQDEWNDAARLFRQMLHMFRVYE